MHPNETLIADRAGMHHRLMADRHKRSHLYAIVVRQVDDAAVLHVRAIADFNTINICAQHTAIPNTSVFTHSNVS